MNSKSTPFDTAILFLVYNRINATKQVFEAIRTIQPTRMYIASDGAKINKPDDHKKVKEVRDYIIENIDWDCSIKTHFRKDNWGCKYSVSDAINWFFENEDKGIILEDDCLPHQDFFKYCDWALKTYHNEKNIWHINGNNFDCSDNLFDSKNISFSALAQVWGWATWRDRWQAYKVNPFYINIDSQSEMARWSISRIAKVNKLNHIDHLQDGLDTWDYQWQVTILNHHGLCVSSRTNLISNIGFGFDATHTKRDNRGYLKTRKINGSLEYVRPYLNKSLTNWYEYKMGLRNIMPALIWLKRILLTNLRSRIKSFLSKLLYRDVNHIVVASTGRSGSTLLFDAITEHFVLNKFNLKKNSIIARSFISVSKTFSGRLHDIVASGIPVHKTHDLFDSKYAGQAKYIFIYSDPLEATKSVEMMIEKCGWIWLEEHLYYLSSSGYVKDLYDKDILNYENQIVSWMSHERDNIFVIKFDDLWKKTDEISTYLGFKLCLPTRQERIKKSMSHNFNVELFNRLRETTKKYS